VKRANGLVGTIIIIIIIIIAPFISCTTIEEGAWHLQRGKELLNEYKKKKKKGKRRQEFKTASLDCQQEQPSASHAGGPL